MRLAAAALGLVVALAPGAALAQEGPVAVRAELDRAVATIGDQLLLTVTVDLAAGYELQDPGVPRTIGDLEVVETLTALQSRLPSGATRVVLRYLVAAFETGPHMLPVIVVGYRGPRGVTGQAETAAGIALTVASVVLPGEDTSDIKPLKPPLALPGAGAELVPRAALAVTGLLVLAGAILIALRRRGSRAGLVPVEGVGPARRALDELQRVLELHLPEQGRTREHYELVSAAVRAFIAERYGLAARSRTARELRHDLEHSGVDRTHAQLLHELLADAESVRYEERVVFPARAQKTMRDVIEVMRKTVVAEEYELVSAEAGA
jgi:hypothetical protein